MELRRRVHVVAALDQSAVHEGATKFSLGLAAVDRFLVHRIIAWSECTGCEIKVCLQSYHTLCVGAAPTW